MRKFLTSESVTEGHPDKICDFVADSILDALLNEDPKSRSAVEVTAEPGAMHIMGEITSKASPNFEKIARRCIAKIGYTRPEYGFDAKSVNITCSIHEQSPDIAMGVDAAADGSKDVGAGDQGMMFGYCLLYTSSVCCWRRWSPCPGAAPHPACSRRRCGSGRIPLAGTAAERRPQTPAGGG